MQPELEELIHNAGIYAGNRPDEYYYKIDVKKILALDGKIKTEEDIENLENYNLLKETLKNHTEWKLLKDDELVEFLMDAVYCNQDFRRANQLKGDR